MLRSPARLVALSGLFALAACDGSKGGPSGASSGATTAAASAATAAAATTTSAPVEAPPPPEDFDVSAQQKALKCAADAKSGACAVLAAMKTCTAWAAAPPSGEGRWLGRGASIEGGKTTDTFVVLRSKRVPLTEVGPGQIGAKIAVAEIPKEEKNAFEQADRAVRTFERGDVVPKSNAAIEYLTKLAQWPDAYATRTKAGHAYIITHGGAFVCAGPKQQLYVARRSATRASAGDGIYAELWPVSW